MISRPNNDMSLRRNSTAAFFVLAAASSGRVNAFVVPTFTATTRPSLVVSSQRSQPTTPFLRQHEKQELALLSMTTISEADTEAERLRSMAAKLRAEASELEAEKSKAMAKAAEQAFRLFDTNQDGEISVEELKAGLEKTFKLELSDTRAEALVESFDSSGDGALQLDEFVNVEQFRNKLEQLMQDEKRADSEARKQAILEAQEQADAANEQQRLEILNDKTPTNTDKILSVLPYLLPLLDALPYGSFLLSHSDNITGASNPVVMALSVLFALYRSVPLSGLIAFTALNFLSSNLSVNRLIRFNAQQAIYMDAALFAGGVVSALVATLAGGGDVSSFPLTEVLSDGIFVTLVASVAYSAMSSLLGVEPDKVPLISQFVKDRMPTMDMFDEDGNFIPRFLRQLEDDDDEEEEEKE